MTTPNIEEMATFTIESRRRKLADNVSDNTALLSRLKMRNKIVPITGGRTIYEELEYDENETYKRFSGYEALNVSPSEVFSAAEFDLRQVAVAVSISGREQLLNAGREAMMDLLTKRISNAEKTMVNGLSEDLYSNGTADGGKQVDGLQAAIIAGAAQDTPPATGTHGGINRANHEFWRNQFRDAGNDTGTSFLAHMMNLWVRTCRNREKIDLIPADNNFYVRFWSALQNQQRFASPQMGRMGFDTLKFNTADVILDGGLGGSAPANRMYFINSEYLRWRPHRDADMRPGMNRYAVNQDAIIKLMFWAGNLTVSNMFVQGILTD